MRHRSFFLLLVVMLMLFGACRQNNADFIIRNARIYTLNERFDTATVLVVKDGKVLAVGGDSLLDQYHALNELNARGGFVYPGFIDAHCHYTGYANDRYKLVLYGCRSFDEVVGKVADYARTSSRTWIEGRLWDQHQWQQAVFPEKDTLDRLFPDQPVFLLRIDGHAALCNQKALDLAGITAATKVEGGEVLLRNGQPTGLLTDNAVELVRKLIPRRTREEAIADFLHAQQDCTSLGLTSVVDCGLTHETWQYLQEAVRRGSFQLGITAMLMDEEANVRGHLQNGPVQLGPLHLIGFKVFADGSLGSRGAKLLQDYHDRPGYRGQWLRSPDSLKKLVAQVANSRMQLAVHAIGDESNREMLKLFGTVLPQGNDRRWRIEHAQVVHPEDIPLFAQHRIVPSVQPTHALSDMAWAEERLGPERMPHAYAYRSLLDQNGWMPLGTDFPVEDLNPLNTFAAAVFRTNRNGKPKGGFQFSQALSREQALRGITIWAARSVFEEKEKGSLEAGKRADFVILPTDLMRADADSIYRTKVKATFIAGKKVYPTR